MTATIPLGIVELAEVCARQRAICLDLFEQLGALVTAPGNRSAADQQLFARACHQHAWHADLWAARAPTIPAGGSAAAVATHRGALEGVTDRPGYDSVIEQLRRELTALRTRFDPLLDPSTDRVISLVLADL